MITVTEEKAGVRVTDTITQDDVIFDDILDALDYAPDALLQATITAEA